MNYLWRCRDCECCKVDNDHEVDECLECGSTNIGELHEDNLNETTQGNKYS